MSNRRVLLVAALALTGCISNNNRRRIPVTNNVPQTREEVADFIANAKAMGCVYEKAPGDGSHEGDGDDSISCPREQGSPRFILVEKANKILCGITKGQEASCAKVWDKLGQPHPH